MCIKMMSYYVPRTRKEATEWLFDYYSTRKPEVSIIESMRRKSKAQIFAWYHRIRQEGY